MANLDTIPKAVVPVKKQYKSRKQREPSRYKKIQDIKKEHPTAKCCFERVDVDGTFCYRGFTFRISSQCEAYQPKIVKGEMLYDMDEVLIVDGEQLTFYDQGLSEIPLTYIEVVMKEDTRC